MRPYLLFTFALFLALPFAALAQFGGAGEGAPPFTLSLDPQYPAPYSEATLSVQSDILDLANATMAVTVAGKRVYQGNARSLSVALGKAGELVSVQVTISSGGANYNQALSIQPQDVSLVAEPISSVPPLYPGKSLIPIGGGTRVVAIANLRSAGGVAADPSSLSYTWTVDDTRIANSSGIGKSAILVASPIQYRARTVSVSVANQDGSLVGGGFISLTPQEPSMRVYENDPLLGIRFDRALPDTYTITGAESTLYAAPFSVPTTFGAPFLQWFLNGSAAQTGPSITLRPSGDGVGSASLSVTTSQGSPVTAVANLSLIFGAKPSTNFFGL